MDEEQTVGIVAPSVIEFDKARAALSAIYEYMADCYGVGVVFGYTSRTFESMPEIVAATRFVTAPNQVHSPSIQIPDVLDPRGVLKAMVTSGKARFTEDNLVLYHNMIWNREE